MYPIIGVVLIAIIIVLISIVLNLKKKIAYIVSKAEKDVSDEDVAALQEVLKDNEFGILDEHGLNFY